MVGVYGLKGVACTFLKRVATSSYSRLSVCGVEHQHVTTRGGVIVAVRLGSEEGVLGMIGYLLPLLDGM